MLRSLACLNSLSANTALCCVAVLDGDLASSQRCDNSIESCPWLLQLGTRGPILAPRDTCLF